MLIHNTDSSGKVDNNGITESIPIEFHRTSREIEPVEYIGYNPTTPYTDRGVFYAGMLTGSQILEEIDKGRIQITPFDTTKINPNSYNVTLNHTLLTYSEEIIDFKKKNETKRIIIPESGLVLQPGVLYLGRTNEECFSDTFIPMINGRSSVGRLGMTIHITAGFGDIGWRGTWTLEIMVVKPLKIYPNIEIAQVCYFTPFGETYMQYDGRYQNQVDTTASRSNLEKKVYL